ncbi:MAG: hypothetical protein ACRDD8_15350 [Bacteroidales bacterium]
MARYFIDITAVDFNEETINDVIITLGIVPQKGDILEFNYSPDVFAHFTMDKDYVKYEFDKVVNSSNCLEDSPLENYSNYNSIELKVEGDGNIDYLEPYDAYDVAYIYGSMSVSIGDNTYRIDGYTFIL